MNTEKKLWNPYAAGVALGLVLLASFVVTGKGLGASGAIAHTQAAAIHAVAPTWAEENANIGGFFSPGHSPFDSWIVLVVIGVAIGGFVGALSGRRTKIETVRGPRVSRDVRLLLALAGGVLSGYAAQLGRGCTSGQALTGGSQLALGSWVFMFAVFGGAYGLAYFVRQQWN